MQDLSAYIKIREKASSFYNKIGRIRCPALNNEFVHFNSEGFNHIIYKGKRKERNRSEQIIKLNLLPKARHIIELSTTYQEYEEGLIEIDRKRFKKKVRETVIARHWGLIAIIRGQRTKVIVRQVGNGQKHFWSVIPSWKIIQYKGIKFALKSKGNLAED